MISAYIAGPYSADSPLDVELNVQRAMTAGDAVEDAGYRAFIPHLSHFRHWHRKRTYGEWMEIDRHWLAKCDVLVRLPGESNGADLEVKWAGEMGIPVFHGVEEFLREMARAA